MPTAAFADIAAQKVDAVRNAYGTRRATDTLVTKVLLGTIGCLPATDRYFIDGFRREKLGYSSLNKKFIERILTFVTPTSKNCVTNGIEHIGGIRYPLMKLVDMCFWQIGYELDSGPMSS